MAKKKDTPVRLDQLTEEEKMKYEIADELGLLDRVMKDGWKSLSSKETGRIGTGSHWLLLNAQKYYKKYYEY